MADEGNEEEEAEDGDDGNAMEDAYGGQGSGHGGFSDFAGGSGAGSVSASAQQDPHAAQQRQLMETQQRAIEALTSQVSALMAAMGPQAQLALGAQPLQVQGQIQQEQAPNPLQRWLVPTQPQQQQVQQHALLPQQEAVLRPVPNEEL